MTHPLVTHLEKAFSPHICSITALGQRAYLRDQFSYLGIKKPLRAAVQKEIFKAYPITTISELTDVCTILWEKPEREYQYAALDLIVLYKKIIDRSFFSFLEWAIRTKSWWDTVDHLAIRGIGNLLKKYPDYFITIDSWIHDPYLWIRRSALICQISFKRDTDSTRLFSYCKQLAHEKDFFIRKAIGWALREYSKTDPASIQLFLEQNSSILSSLSYKEASKRLSKNNSFK